VNRFLTVSAFSAVLLLVCGAFLFWFGDKEIFTPPPHAVAESFFRELETGRYSRALPYLSEQLSSKTSEKDLHLLALHLEVSLGRAIDVRGEDYSRENDEAQAKASITTKSGKYILTVECVWENGVWVISEFPKL